MFSVNLVKIIFILDVYVSKFHLLKTFYEDVCAIGGRFTMTSKNNYVSLYFR